MFNALQMHFNRTKDDALILSSHKFLNDESNNEKDFIIVNLRKGYVCVVEVKANSNRFSKAKNQFKDSKNRLAEVFNELSLPPAWKVVNLFYAQHGEMPFECPKDKCTKYTIIGEDTIADKINLIEQEIFQVNKDWDPKNHVSEFIELFKQLVFIAQGNPYAPVTASALLKKTSNDIDKAGTPENIFFWTPGQLVIADAVAMNFMFLDAFYSTGKTVLLKYRARYLGKEKKKCEKRGEAFGNIYYFINTCSKDLNVKMPFTMVIEHEFKEQKLEVIVKQTNLNLGFHSIQDFIAENNIGVNDHVCFDEAICFDKDKFEIGIAGLKRHVASLWLAMGGTNCANDVDVGYLLDNEFQCPKLDYPLRNPLIIAKYATESVHAEENLLLPLLRQPVDVQAGTNMSSGCLSVNSVNFADLEAAIIAALDELSLNPQIFAMIFINSWSKTRPYIHEMIQNAFRRKSRELPIIISSENVYEDILKKWLCLIEKRTSDCVVINNGSGLLQTGSIECNGIEADIVVQVYSVCASGKCKNSTLNPVVSTRAKAKLVITKFSPPECERCDYKSAESAEIGAIAEAEFKATAKAMKLMPKVWGPESF